MKRKTTLLIISTSSALILGLWLGAWYVGTEQTVIRQFTSQPLADVFSSINALFAGFAFCGVILTVYLQIQELQDTREVLAETAKANNTTAEYAKENAIVELFQTYCSDYFQNVKNSSMNILIPAMASRGYFDFVISRFFVAEQLSLSEADWPRISLVSRYSTFEEFKENEAGDVIARCDFSYSWWRPMFWMIAIAQELRYDNSPTIQKYGTALYFKEVVKMLDEAYALKPIETGIELVDLIKEHPKLSKQYQLDDLHKLPEQWEKTQ